MAGDGNDKVSKPLLVVEPAIAHPQRAACESEREG